MEDSETIILVSCTEHGRWDYSTLAFSESGNIMSQNLRAKKSSSVHQTLKEAMSYRGNQGEVWDDIQCLAVQAKVHSRTGAIGERDIFQGVVQKHSCERVCVHSLDIKPVSMYTYPVQRQGLISFLCYLPPWNG